MAERGAPIGNNNGGKNKPWADALRKALVQYTDDNVAAGQALFKVAQVVVTQALAGDKDSINEIGNRMDGKPAQSVSVSGEGEDGVIEFAIIKRVIVDPKS